MPKRKSAEGARDFKRKKNFSCAEVELLLPVNKVNKKQLLYLVASAVDAK